MIEMLKKLFGKKQEAEYVPDPPGRTFNRVLTGRYFGCENPNADKAAMDAAKQEKIEQINELELKPMFVRYAYKKAQKNDKAHDTDAESHPLSAHVSFQKEVMAKNWNMVHVTEISFTVLYADFDEFEKMAGVSLSDDFKDLTSTTFSGKERRKKKRDT